MLLQDDEGNSIPVLPIQIPIRVRDNAVQVATARAQRQAQGLPYAYTPHVRLILEWQGMAPAICSGARLTRVSLIGLSGVDPGCSKATFAGSRRGISLESVHPVRHAKGPCIYNTDNHCLLIKFLRAKS